jgi:tRNA uridine 5-carboxymethylaminomethyl modification enzyme
MFTSRAEYRLSLRSDNADLRLTRKGKEIGCVGDARFAHFEAREQRFVEAKRLVENIKLPTHSWVQRGFDMKHDGVPKSVAEVLERHEISFQDVKKVFPDELGHIDDATAESVKIECT